MVNRRDFVRRALGAAALALVTPRLARAAAPTSMTVYKSPTCGCCKAWIAHVEANGFRCTAVDVNDVTPMKRTTGVPRGLESCHTALVGPYVIEGHVPADLIQKLLRDKPAVRGLAVPGMPIGSPGMETGGAPQPYKVMAFLKDGSSRVYASR